MTEQQILHFVQIAALVVMALIVIIECSKGGKQ